MSIRRALGFGCCSRVAWQSPSSQMMECSFGFPSSQCELWKLWVFWPFSLARRVATWALLTFCWSAKCWFAWQSMPLVATSILLYLSFGFQSGSNVFGSVGRWPPRFWNFLRLGERWSRLWSVVKSFRTSHPRLLDLSVVQVRNTWAQKQVLFITSFQGLAPHLLRMHKRATIFGTFTKTLLETWRLQNQTSLKSTLRPAFEFRSFCLVLKETPKPQGHHRAAQI